MNQNHCKFYSFLKAVRGNWHNALFIECRCNSCPHKKTKVCEGYLLTADAGGELLLIPVERLSQLTGESIEPTECRGNLSKQAFESLYSQYIEWHTVTDTDCPLRQLCLDIKCLQ